MAHGLIWLPLLGLFIGLAWAGWQEYHKLEAYRRWAADYDRSKYDIYAVLGQKGDRLSWGKPTRQGPINLETLSLNQIEAVAVRVDGQGIDPSDPPTSGRKIVLEITVTGANSPIEIPFTEITLAIDWCQHLQASLRYS